MEKGIEMIISIYLVFWSIQTYAMEKATLTKVLLKCDETTPENKKLGFTSQHSWYLCTSNSCTHSQNYATVHSCNSRVIINQALIKANTIKEK